MAEIQSDILKCRGRKAVGRFIQAKSDAETITAWKSNLNRILHVFNVRSVGFTWLSPTVPPQTELAMNTHVAVSDIRHDVSKIREEISDRAGTVSATFCPSQ